MCANPPASFDNISTSIDESLHDQCSCIFVAATENLFVTLFKDEEEEEKQEMEDAQACLLLVKGWWPQQLFANCARTQFISLLPV